MKTNNKPDLAERSETGTTGILQLKRLWSKAMAGTDLNSQSNMESEMEFAILDILGLGLLPTYQFLYSQKPDFNSFEQWVIKTAGDRFCNEKIRQCNDLSDKKTTLFTTYENEVLTAADLSFWDEFGYVVIKNAISKEDCSASCKAIWNFLEMDAQIKDTWYQSGKNVQGIMVPLYRDAALDKNRNSATIKRAFEQLWKQNDLIAVTDKCGFNPPETDKFRYRGIGLHWDVSLATPISFGTQGILYLTDTATHQGALTLIPGFHKTIESWLATLDTDPRETDFSNFRQLPIAANAGDFIIWNHKLPHSSSANRSNSPRLVQYINWVAPFQQKQEVWI
jgi:hypothetical protein